MALQFAQIRRLFRMTVEIQTNIVRVYLLVHQLPGLVLKSFKVQFIGNSAQTAIKTSSYTVRRYI